MRYQQLGDKMKIILLQPVRFLLVGVANTFFGLSIIFAAKAIAGLDDFVSNMLGYSLGLSISFFLNRKWTFRHSGSVFPTASRFFIAFLAAYIANIMVVYGLRDGWGVNSYLAQAMGVFPYTIIFYLSSRYYVFPVDRH